MQCQLLLTFKEDRFRFLEDGNRCVVCEVMVFVTIDPHSRHDASIGARCSPEADSSTS